MRNIYLILILVSQSSFAQIPNNTDSIKLINYFEKESTNPAKVYSIATKYYSDNREVIVHTPASYSKSSDSRYPVLYLLDGKSKLKHVIFTTNILAKKLNMPEIIIIALPAGNTRQQDYTPNYLSMHSSNQVGNANNFSKYLEFDLIPFVDKNFRTEPYRIVSGHSRSGLFVINDLINKTRLFQAHFAFSPALWPNEFRIINKMTQKQQANKPYSGFLYANIGDKENQKMHKSLQKLSTQLEKFSNNKFNWHTNIVADESHSTTAIIGHHMAFRKLYTNWDKPWQVYKQGGLKTIEKRYNLLSDEFNYRVIPDQRAINSIGYRFLQNKQISKAIEAFEMNIRYYPKSANSYDSLADALESNGAIDLAIKAMDKAISLLNGEHNPNLAPLKKHRDKLYILKSNHKKSKDMSINER
jgi:predicted alpha/beta superfamily hydrolase